MMTNIDFILSNYPNTIKLSQVFYQLGFDKCVFTDTNLDKIFNTDNVAYIDILETQDSQWQCHLSICLNKSITHKTWFYFNLAKQISESLDCHIICCYYDNDIISCPDTNNPFYDFAYIDNHWYLIDDSHSTYANHDTIGDIVIIKSIHQDMTYFLEHDD